MKKIKKGVLRDTKNNTVLKKYNLDSVQAKTNFKREYYNLKRMQNFNSNIKIKFPKIITHDEKKGTITIEYIRGTNLKDVKKPHIFFLFGQELKKIHNEGFTHSHLEIHDVIYQKPYFYMVDLMMINAREKEYDFARIILSLATYMVKKPWKWNFYKKSIVEFKKGYKPESKTERKFVLKELESTIESYERKKHINKLKAVIIKTIIKRIILRALNGKTQT